MAVEDESILQERIEQLECDLAKEKRERQALEKKVGQLEAKLRNLDSDFERHCRSTR